jgi:hypothetical protein
MMSLALRLALQLPVAAHHAHDRCRCPPSRSWRRRRVELRRRHFGQQLGELDRRRVAVWKNEL